MKRFLSILLIIILLAGTIISAYSILHQPAASVQDLTAGPDTENSGNPQSAETAAASTEGSDGLGGSDPVAVLNPNVSVFNSEENNQINKAIKSVELIEGDCRIMLDNTVPDSFKTIGTGDVFFLDGTSDTPMGEPFFGKVVSMEDRNGEIELICNTPSVDEVFDKLDINMSEVIAEEDIKDIQAIPGVEVKVGESLDNVSIAADGSNNGAAPIRTADSQAWHAERLANSQTMESKGASVVFEFKDVDIGKVFNIVSDAIGSDKRIPGANEADIAVGGDKEDEDKTSLTMSGKVGLDNIRIRSNVDCSMDYDTYIRNLSVGASADFAASLEVKYQLANVKIHGADTEAKIAEWLKLQGLEKKVFPIAYFDVVTKRTITFLTNDMRQGIDTLTKAPVSFGVEVYSDIDGNLSIESTLKFSWRRQIDSGDYVFVRDGKWVMGEVKNDTLDATADYSWEFEASVQADVNAEVLGVSVQMYIFNLNVVDIALAKLGVEAQGKASLKAGSKVNGIEAEAKGYMRGYLKLIDVCFGFKAELKTMFFKTDVDLGFKGTLLDLTLFEYGQKNETSFDRRKMTYRQLAAQDDKDVFYKDLNGYLVRANSDGGGRLTISKDDFFSICGMDKSYIYVLKNADSAGVYNICRVARDGNSSRDVVSGVLWALYEDEKYLYYVPEFNNCSISRMDRATLDTEEFATFGEPVQLMMNQNDTGYLISCGEPSDGWFSSPNTYYLLSLDGKQNTSLGTDLTTDNLWRCRKGDSVYLEYPSCNGYLRSTAKDIYVQPKDGSEPVLTERTSGWNPLEEGVFTTLNSQNGSGLPYEIVLYSAETGERIHIADVTSSCAFFTLCKDKYGKWYYFDQTDTQLVLHRMDKDFSNDTVLETFDRSKINYNLTDCGMALFGDRIYFYTMPDNRTSVMLYRYSITQ